MLHSQRGADIVQLIVKHLITKLKVNDTQKKWIRSQGDDAIDPYISRTFQPSLLFSPSFLFSWSWRAHLTFLLTQWVLGNIVLLAPYGFNKVYSITFKHDQDCMLPWNDNTVFIRMMVTQLMNHASVSMFLQAVVATYENMNCEWRRKNGIFSLKKKLLQTNTAL